MRTSPFFKQADLLVQVIPFVNMEACFALKGGTAINFFVRNFPRLSVDLDLVYLPVEARPTTLRGIDAALQRIAARIRRAMPTVQVRGRKLGTENHVVKLTLRAESGAEVKIEPNTQGVAGRVGCVGGRIVGPLDWNLRLGFDNETEN